MVLRCLIVYCVEVDRTINTSIHLNAYPPQVGNISQGMGLHDQCELLTMVDMAKPKDIVVLELVIYDAADMVGSPVPSS